MGKATAHIPVKLIIGIISGEVDKFFVIQRTLEKKFGNIDLGSALFDFSCTDYYEEELGRDLKRRFLSFKKLISLRRNYEIKLYTNKIERKFLKNGNRTINLDPGYVTLSSLILFTTKPRSHRIYIESGIYAEAELQFVNKSFRPLEWTYPDYKTQGYIDFFNGARSAYLKQIKEGYKVNVC